MFGAISSPAPSPNALNMPSVTAVGSAAPEALRGARRKARLVCGPNHPTTDMMRLSSSMKAPVADQSTASRKTAIAPFRPAAGVRAAYVNMVSARPCLARERRQADRNQDRVERRSMTGLIRIKVENQGDEKFRPEGRTGARSPARMIGGKPRIVEVKGMALRRRFFENRSRSTSTISTSRASSARSAKMLGEAKVNIATFHLGRQAAGGEAIALVLHRLATLAAQQGMVWLEKRRCPAAGSLCVKVLSFCILGGGAHTARLSLRWSQQQSGLSWSAMLKP